MQIAVILTPNDERRLNIFTSEINNQIRVWEEEIYIQEAVMDYGMPRRGINNSHKAIITKAKNGGWSEVMILEDDVRFHTDNAIERLFNMWKIIPKNKDILFGGIYDGEVSKEFSIYCSLKGRLSGLHCYIVNAPYYDSILSIPEELNLDYGISVGHIGNFYCAYPMLATQYDGYSYNAQAETKYNYNLSKKFKIYEGK